MRKLDVSSISDSSQMPVKKGTLQFLQDSYTEITKSVMSSLAGGNNYDPAKVYVLYGVINSGIYPIYNIVEGAVFYNGEIFQVDAASFTATGSNVAVCNIVQTQYTTDADPVTFTDASVRNIHNIRKMGISQGASGSGISDISTFVYLDFNIPKQLSLTVNGNATLSGTYPDLVITVSSDPIGTVKMFAGDVNTNFNSSGLGITAQWLGWALANGQNNTVDLRGRVPVQITNSDTNDHGYVNSVKNDTDFATVGSNGGEKKHQLTVNELANHKHQDPTNQTQGSGGTNVGGYVYGTFQQDATHDTTSVGGDAPHNNMQPYFVLAFVQKIS